MRSAPNLLVESFRISSGIQKLDVAGSKSGLFLIPYLGPKLKVIATDECGWDHVSVSLENRCPIWEEMQYVKKLFFLDNETAVQYHPRVDQYVNNHRYCLHLFRPQNVELPLPLPEMIGIKTLGTLN